MMMFLNADMTGPATSGEDAMTVQNPETARLCTFPFLVPLTDFEDAPDLRPGGADVPE